MAGEDYSKYIGTKVRHRNPFRGIHIYKTPQELLEITLSRAKKAVESVAGERITFEKKRKLILARFKKFCDETSDRLIDIIRKHPSIDDIHPFYRSILEIYVSIDDLKKALGKIFGAANLIKKFEKKYMREIKSIRYVRGDKSLIEKAYRDLEDKKREAYGRVASIVKSLRKELKLLYNVVISMKRLPDLNPNLPTIVVVGPPNTGKSSLVKKFSKAKVEIASYPFTTKNITFGHMNLNGGKGGLKVQIVDTPGLFDRPLEKRKKEELLAVKALTTIGRLVLFIFDPSIESALDVESQLNVFEETLKLFGKKDFIIPIINKMDIKDEERLKKLVDKLEEASFKDKIKYISILTDQGLEDLGDVIKRRMLQIMGLKG
ncbi:MAG: NOG1 family protein [Candidatus Njordarchaeia archaeon]